MSKSDIKYCHVCGKEHDISKEEYIDDSVCGPCCILCYSPLEDKPLVFCSIRDCLAEYYGLCQRHKGTICLRGVKK
jgi:hypothetical protein